LQRREELARVPIPTVPGATFGALVDSGTDFLDTRLSASRSTATGAHVGAIVKVSDRVSLGARYLTKVKLTYVGTADFTPLTGSYRVTRPNPLGLPVGTSLDAFVAPLQAAFQDQTASTDVTMPAQFVVGGSWHVDDRMVLRADYQWVGWSAFDIVTLDFSQPLPPDEPLLQNYRSTSAALLGVEYGVGRAAGPDGDQHRTTLRAGYFFNQAAAPDDNVTPLLPDARRHHFNAGVGWTISDRLNFDIAYQFVHHDDRRGRVDNPAPGQPATTALNSGVYQSRGDLLAFTITYRR
jgi:long-chain fatty acid transport protein